LASIGAVTLNFADEDLDAIRHERAGAGLAARRA